jgi:hypothetical protein
MILQYIAMIFELVLSTFIIKGLCNLLEHLFTSSLNFLFSAISFPHGIEFKVICDIEVSFLEWVGYRGMFHVN